MLSIPVKSITNDTKLWHMWLGHFGERGMLKLHKKNTLKGVRMCKLDFCKYCVYGNQYRFNFMTSSHTSKSVFDYVYWDVWGKWQCFLTVVLIALSASLMIIWKRYWFILWSISLMFLVFLRSESACWKSS